MLTSFLFMENNKQAFFSYLKLEKNYSDHTVNAYLNDLDVFEKFIFETYEQSNIIEVHYSQIRNWIVSLSDTKLSALTINRKIASLKAFYLFLLKTKQISVSPLLQHKALKSQRKIQVPFSEKEMANVLNEDFQEDLGFENLRDTLIVELLYASGMRRAELIGLKVSDIDFSNGTIRVLGKRDKERIIPMLPKLGMALKKYILERAKLEDISNKSNLFLTNKGVKLNNSFVYRIINSYLSQVTEKVKKSPHMLRHTFATHLLNNGADLNSVKELLGHSSLASTQVYTHSSLAELKKVHGTLHPRSRK